VKNILALEELAQLTATYLGTLWIGYDWWVFFALLLLPDISMIGYIINTQVGAFTYNLVHHKGMGAAIAIAGIFTGVNWLLLAGLVLYGHSAMDRIFGYGLKYGDDFKHTHLGWMGQKARRPAK
jgi:hypothetical protein